MRLVESLIFACTRTATRYIDQGRLDWTRWLLPATARRAITSKLNYWKTRNSPDRTVLLGIILPKVVKPGNRVLWVGCKNYTADYPGKIENLGGICWTLDIDPRVAKWGHPTRHFIGDLCNVESLFGKERFDLVICNGVFGWGIDSEVAQQQALHGIFELLKTDGLLLLGWNTDRIGDPIHEASALNWFIAENIGNLPARIAIDRTTHTYDFLRPRARRDE